MWQSLCFLQWILSIIIFHAILRKFSEKSLSKPFTKDILSLSIYFYRRMMILADIFLLKVNNRNTKTRCEICSKLTIKNTRMTSIASFCCFYCSLWAYFTPCSSVSTVNFEHVIAGWDESSKSQSYYPVNKCVKYDEDTRIIWSFHS